MFGKGYGGPYQGARTIPFRGTSVSDPCLALKVTSLRSEDAFTLDMRHVATGVLLSGLMVLADEAAQLKNYPIPL